MVGLDKHDREDPRPLIRATATDLARVAQPETRLKIEILQQTIAALRIVVLSELGSELDVGIGFNAADGD